MNTFVLVHGAWHGGWCWRRVYEQLTNQGHQVFTPTLTGLGERAHLLTRQINLDTHITDVISLLEAEELKNVILRAPNDKETRSVQDRLNKADAFMHNRKLQILKPSYGMHPLEKNTE